MIAGILVIWNLIGMVFFLIPFIYYSLILFGSSTTIEFLNPIWLRKRSNMNIIGITFHIIIYNSLCPIITFLFWMYKTFTFKGWY
jgi:hypothetical protein